MPFLYNSAEIKLAPERARRAVARCRVVSARSGASPASCNARAAGAPAEATAEVTGDAQRSLARAFGLRKAAR